MILYTVEALYTKMHEYDKKCRLKNVPNCGTNVPSWASTRCTQLRDEHYAHACTQLRDSIPDAVLIGLVYLVLFRCEVLGKRIRVAQALKHGVHEARIAVVAQPDHARDFIPEPNTPKLFVGKKRQAVLVISRNVAVFLAFFPREFGRHFVTDTGEELSDLTERASGALHLRSLCATDDA